MALPILDGNQSATTLSTILAGGEHTPAHTVVSLGSTAISNITSAVSGSVVSISNFPATQPISGSISISGTPSVTFSAVTISNFPSTQTIAGTVTANLANVVTNDLYWSTQAIKVTGGNGNGVELAGIDGNGATAIFQEGGALPVIGRNNEPIAISGTVTANMMGFDCVNNEYSPIPVLPYSEPIDCGNTVIVRLTDTNATDLNLTNGMPISGTVTVGAMPSGALTTRFGSVTTANTAQLTSAVTNTSRKYLLVQNIATSTVTIGIGFAPTTTQGIQLTAGAGLTFDAFCPTGGVWWLSSTTGSNWSILEG